MFELFAVGKPVPEGTRSNLQKMQGERCFLTYSDAGLLVTIVLRSISKKEIEEFKDSLSVIYQEFEVPFLVLKYKKMSFDMPILPMEDMRFTKGANSLIIHVIDHNGFILKGIRLLGLDKNLAAHIENGINSVAHYSPERLADYITKNIYPKYSPRDMYSGGIRQRFERSTKPFWFH